jgi:hypothetical protein
VVVAGDAARARLREARLGYVNVLGDEDDGRNATSAYASAAARCSSSTPRGQVGSVRIEPPYDEPHAASRFAAALTSA